MDSLNDFDRELTLATQVQPAGDFTARVRARIADDVPAPRWRVSRLVFAAGAVVAVIMVAISLPGTSSMTAARSLPHEDLAVFVPLAAVASPDVPALTRAQPAVRMVLVEKTEMLALQRLFAGEFVAPPEPPVAGELTINEVAIVPIAVPTIEGEQQ